VRLDLWGFENSQTRRHTTDRPDSTSDTCPLSPASLKYTSRFVSKQCHSRGLHISSFLGSHGVQGGGDTLRRLSAAFVLCIDRLSTQIARTRFILWSPFGRRGSAPHACFTARVPRKEVENVRRDQQRTVIIKTSKWESSNVTKQHRACVQCRVPVFASSFVAVYLEQWSPFECATCVV